MITKEDRKKALENIVDDMQKLIVSAELDIRNVEVLKIKANDNDLIKLEESILNNRKLKVAWEAKLETALDAIKEL